MESSFRDKSSRAEQWSLDYFLHDGGPCGKGLDAHAAEPTDLSGNPEDVRLRSASCAAGTPAASGAEAPWGSNPDRQGG